MKLDLVSWTRARGLIIFFATAALSQGISWSYPTAPKWLSSQALIRAGVLGFLAVGIFYIGAWLYPKIPSRPLFPDNPLGLFSWLRRRPVISLITMVPKGRWDSGKLVDCSLSLTIFHAFEGVASAAFDYERAELDVVQASGGKRRRFLFRPVKSGGFLTWPLRQSDPQKAFQIDFVWIGQPAEKDRAPDLSGAFEWRLSGVRATIHGARELRGRLPNLEGRQLSAQEWVRAGSEAAALPR